MTGSVNHKTGMRLFLISPACACAEQHGCVCALVPDRPSIDMRRISWKTCEPCPVCLRPSNMSAHCCYAQVRCAVSMQLKKAKQCLQAPLQGDCCAVFRAAWVALEALSDWRRGPSSACMHCVSCSMCVCVCVCVCAMCTLCSLLDSVSRMLVCFHAVINAIISSKLASPGPLVYIGFRLCAVLRRVDQPPESATTESCRKRMTQGRRLGACAERLGCVTLGCVTLGCMHHWEGCQVRRRMSLRRHMDVHEDCGTPGLVAHVARRAVHLRELVLLELIVCAPL
ncbi:hypothetical protein DUNSADRAFT_17605 [Dunaliella salina]|uniref:Encoded protein n=1 Tax=Dunaliella salina TaxID=3046 RepID=A0ABQ7G1H6_DUNSA|nr:hypothetical protein DUNSADRAFT_17605 [Dunaliella salina]|eukprot:KAF5828442.1 hypothetical protein DUNSADRAFT_17605 [Dunaliella salina]